MRGIIEYVTVTGNEDDYLDCTGQTTQRTYRKVEWIESSHIDSPPQVGDIGILMEIQNDEYVFIGRLKQYKSSEVPGEIRIFGNRNVGLVIKEAGAGYSLELYKATLEEGNDNTAPIYTPTTTIKINEDGSVKIESSGVVQVTGAELQLNGSTVGIAREGDDVSVTGTTGSAVGPGSHTHSINITAAITSSSHNVKTN